MPASSRPAAGAVVGDTAAARELPFGGVALIAVAHALAFAGAFPPINAWPLVLAVPVLLTWIALGARSLRAALTAVFVTQVLMWLWLDRWLIGVTAVGYPAKALYMTVFALVFVWGIRRVVRHPRWGRCPLAILVPVLWIALEMLRGKVVFDGYPWFLLAHPIIAVPAAAQSADLLGTYFVGFLVASLAGAIVDLVRVSVCRVECAGKITAAVVIACVWAINVTYGLWRMGDTSALRSGPKLVAVQTNVPQSNKIAWTREAQRSDVASFLALSRAALAATEGADALIWPETMLPVRGLEPETLATLKTFNQVDDLEFAAAVFDLSESAETPMIVGSLCFVGLGVDLERQQWTWTTQYNSAYLIDGRERVQRYDKHVLTPFGEIMPYLSAWPWLEQRLLSLGAAGMTFGLDANPVIELLEMPWERDVLVMATPICFEDTIPRACRRMAYKDGAKRASVFVNLSNDGWFGEYDSTRAQHVQIARFRCIENRVPMVRCVNTGLSVSIDSVGRIAAEARPAAGAGRGPAPEPPSRGAGGAPRSGGWLVAEVTLDLRGTVYGHIGDLWAWGCLGLATAITAAASFGRRT